MELYATASAAISSKKFMAGSYKRQKNCQYRTYPYIAQLFNVVFRFIRCPGLRFHNGRQRGRLGRFRRMTQMHISACNQIETVLPSIVQLLLEGVLLSLGPFVKISRQRPKDLHARGIRLVIVVYGDCSGPFARYQQTVDQRCTTLLRSLLRHNLQFRRTSQISSFKKKKQFPDKPAKRPRCRSSSAWTSAPETNCYRSALRPATWPA